jgi:hypothetical protein
VNWLQKNLRDRVSSFREYQGLAPLPAHLQHIIDGAMQIVNAPPPPPRVVQPMLTGDVEEAAAGMAALNGEDFTAMTEAERQPYRESATDQILTASKKRELDRQAELERSGAFDGLDGH